MRPRGRRARGTARRRRRRRRPRRRDCRASGRRRRRPAGGQQGLRQASDGGRGRPDRDGPHLRHRGRGRGRPRRVRRRPTSSRTTGWPRARASWSPTTATPHSPTPPPVARVLVEEYLDGPEVSLFCVTDGTAVRPAAPAQDYKRIFDDDQGPNTGGMGAYTPLPWAPADLVDEIIARGRPTHRGAEMRARERRSSACSTPGWPSPARPARRGVQRPLRRPRDPGRAAPRAHPARCAAARSRYRVARRHRATPLAGRRRGHGRPRRCWLPGLAPNRATSSRASTTLPPSRECASCMPGRRCATARSSRLGAGCCRSPGGGATSPRLVSGPTAPPR